MLFYRIPIHLDDWHGRHEYAEKFPEYPYHAVRFILDRLNQFHSIHWWKQTCDNKVWKKIDHEFTSDFLSFYSLDQLTKKAIRRIREASDYNGHYSVMYRSSDESTLIEFLSMFEYDGQIIEFGTATRHAELVAAVSRLMTRFGPDQYYIAISHDTWDAGIFAEETFLMEIKRSHEEIVKKLGESGAP